MDEIFSLLVCLAFELPTVCTDSETILKDWIFWKVPGLIEWGEDCLFTRPLAYFRAFCHS